MRLRIEILNLVLIVMLWLPAISTGQQKDQGGQQGQSAAPLSAQEAAQAPVEGQPPLAPTPDARSNSGAEVSARSSGAARSYFLPSFEFSEMGDSNFNIGAGPQRFE